MIIKYIGWEGCFLSRPDQISDLTIFLFICTHDMSRDAQEEISCGHAHPVAPWILFLSDKSKKVAINLYD